jgi:chitinase
VDAAVQGYLRAGVLPAKIVLGMPFYGKAWGGVSQTDNGLYQIGSANPEGQGGYAYKNLAAKYIGAPGYTRYWHEEAKVPWLYSAAEKIFISYDDAESIGLKLSYALEHKLAGVMFWELTCDDGTLLSAVNEKIK